MFVVNFIFLLFVNFFNKINTQGNEIDLDVCYPITFGLNMLSEQQPDCRALSPYTNELDLRCCELDFQEKNKPDTRRRGCMAFLGNYIDDDRYEDIIDWIERGKYDKFTEYTLFLGYSGYMNFTRYGELVKNKTKYEVFKFDCFGEFFKNKFLFNIFVILLFVFF